jgi:hypothetical protein
MLAKASSKGLTGSRFSSVLAQVAMLSPELRKISGSALCEIPAGPMRKELFEGKNRALAKFTMGHSAIAKYQNLRITL